MLYHGCSICDLLKKFCSLHFSLERFREVYRKYSCNAIVANYIHILKAKIPYVVTKGSCTYDLKPIKKTKLKLSEYQNFKDEWVGFYTISYDHHLAFYNSLSYWFSCGCNKPNKQSLESNKWLEKKSVFYHRIVKSLSFNSIPSLGDLSAYISQDISFA